MPPRWCFVALSLSLAACGSGEPTAPSTTTEPASGEPSSAAEPTDPVPSGASGTSAEPAAQPAATTSGSGSTTPSSLDTATACARARPCCAAFVDAIGDPIEAERARIACEQMDHLEELGEASGEACIAALDGWRRTLEQAEREVPVSCR